MKIRRIITRASVFLLLGAIINVAAAWTLTFVFSPLNTRMEDQVFARGPLQEPDSVWHVIVKNMPAGQRVNCAWRRHAGMILGPMNEGMPEKVWPNWLQWALPRETNLAMLSRSVDADARGWPVLSLWGGVIEEAEPHQTTNREYVLVVGDYSHRGYRYAPRYLPFVPIWPGFAINTVFYAAILWGLFAAPFALRRQRRIKRGLCPKCAYPVGASEVCTECGDPLAKHKAQTQKAQMP